MSSIGDRIFAAMLPRWQRLGVSGVRNHFYEPIPDLRGLPEALWVARSAVPGVDLRIDEQVRLLADFAARYRAEYSGFARAPSPRSSREFCLDNDQFTKVDAEVLYCMIRANRPRRIIEIGGGNSTLVSAAAIRANVADDSSYRCRLTTIEPFPSPLLTNSAPPEMSELIVSNVQDVALDRFFELEANDILFVDSSHVLRTGSDVQFEFLDILPRVATGVLVHVHDIFLPAEYPRQLIVDWHRFWTEQYLLQAFLAFNCAFEVLWGSCAMHLLHPGELGEAIPSYREMGWPSGLPPSSMWIRRIAQPAA